MDLQRFKESVTSKEKAIKKTFKKLEKLKPKVLDQHFHEAHTNAFEHIDCLTCGNCCKSTGPLLIDRDIERIASHLRIRPSQLVDDYLRIDEDGDYVMNSLPCPFLGVDNYCSIYSVRPRACREFPHTDRKNMQQILKLTKRNTKECPAVFEMVQKIEQHLPK